MKTKQIKETILFCLKVWRGLIVGKSGCGKNNTFAEPSASTQLARLFKTFCFRKEFVSTRIQNFQKKVLKNNCWKVWLWICLKIKMKYKKNKFHRVCWLKSWQKINAPIPKSLLSVFLWIGRRCAWPKRTVSRSKESHDIWRSLASEAKQVRSLLRS